MRGSSGTIRILHVDDEPHFSKMAAEFLVRQDERFDITRAASASDALEALSENTFQCIVSDFDMPGQDGIEFLETVREHHGDVPFILYTGKGSEEVASEAISAGVTDYLQKERGSSQYEVLANRIRNAVGQFTTERELDRSQDLLQHTEELADIGGWEADVETGEQRWTAGTYRIHDLSPDADFDPTVDAGVEFYHPEDRDEIERLVERCMETGEPFDTELRMRTAEGRLLWVRATGEAVREDGDIVTVRGAIHDVTDQREREAQLERDRAQFNALFKHSIDAIVFAEFVDGEPIVRDVNAAFEETFGYEGDSAIGRPIDALVVPDDSDDLREAADLNRRIVGGERVVTEVRRRTADGVKDFLLQSTPLEPGESGTRTYAIYTDISEHNERERELERQNERLDRFASVVSHDLRDPLNLAEGRLELARAECDSDHLDDVDYGIDRSLSLIEDLLVLAHEGARVGAAEAVDLEAVVERCWRSVETADATVTVALDGAIRADESRVTQLLENLLRNAVEHWGEDVAVEIGALPGGFYVADDGPGIPEADRECVFEPGYSSSDAGNGLGLDIAREIAEAHGWNIRVTDSESGGARFEFTGVADATD